MTNTPPRKLPFQAVHYIRGTVGFADDGSVVAIGTIPNGALIIKAMSGVLTTTAFDDTTTDLMDIGYAAYVNSSDVAVVADPNAFGTLLDVAATGYDLLDEAAADFLADANSKGIEITASYNGATGDPSVGAAQVVICYTMPDA